MGITEQALINYILDRVHGNSYEDALFQLLQPLHQDMKDAEFVGAIVGRFPTISSVRATGQAA